MQIMACFVGSGEVSAFVIGSIVAGGSALLTRVSAALQLTMPPLGMQIMACCVGAFVIGSIVAGGSALLTRVSAALQLTMPPLGMQIIAC